MTYTIMANAVEKAKRVFNRYAKKAKAIGLKATFEVVKEYEKRVPRYEYDDVNHCAVKKGEVIIDVADVEINFPEYKLGDYTVAAVIEHGEGDNNNMVYPCGNYTIPTKYHTGKGVCEHCGTNHRRVKTVLLINNNEEFKQVGTNCLKEYTGVTEIGLIGAYEAITNYMEENLADRGFYGTATRFYVETFDYLARCIHIYTEYGYNTENKNKADNAKFEINEVDRNKAKEVIDFFEKFETTDTFLLNVKTAVTREFTKPVNGFIAYAIVAYEKEVARIARENKRAEEVVNTVYYGNVGDKIELEVTGKCIAGYDTQFGYTYIYRFTDNENHTFIWKTTNTIETNDEGIFTGIVRGTIKEHNEYRGEKQTVLTRCKAREKVNA